MGNMSEEMRKVMAKWNAPEEAQEQTASDKKRETYRHEIYDVIKANPGATSNKVLEIVLQRGLTQSYSSVTSQITTMFQDFLLRREQIPNPAGIGRDVYTYYAVPEETAAKLKAEHKRKQLQAKLRAERARQAKAEKAAARAAAQAEEVVVEQTPVQLSLPLPLPEVTATPAPTPVLNLQSMTAMEILNGINFAQARDLYKELKEAFGS
jgi:hypothetical protein